MFITRSTFENKDKKNTKSNEYIKKIIISQSLTVI